MALSSYTVERKCNCGPIYTTITIDSGGKHGRTLVSFGKAGGCGSAVGDGIQSLLTEALMSGMDPHKAANALKGISCHKGPNTCMKAISDSLRFVLLARETGRDINDIVEEEDMAEANLY